MPERQTLVAANKRAYKSWTLFVRCLTSKRVPSTTSDSEDARNYPVTAFHRTAFSYLNLDNRLHITTGLPNQPRRAFDNEPSPDDHCTRTVGRVLETHHGHAFHRRRAFHILFSGP